MEKKNDWYSIAPMLNNVLDEQKGSVQFVGSPTSVLHLYIRNIGEERWMYVYLKWLEGGGGEIDLSFHAVTEPEP